MVQKIAIIIIFCSASILGQSQSRWDVGMYNRYNHVTFPEIAHTKHSVDTLRPDLSLLNAALFFEINRQRAIHDINVLTHDSRLERHAMSFCKESIANKIAEQNEEQKESEPLYNRLAKAGFTDSLMHEMAHETLLLNSADTDTVLVGTKHFFTLDTGDSIAYHSYLSLAKSIVGELMGNPEIEKQLLLQGYTHSGIGCGIFFDSDEQNTLPMVRCHILVARILPATSLAIPSNKKGKTGNAKTQSDTDEQNSKKPGKRQPMKEKEYGASLIAISKRPPQPSEPLPFQLNKGEIKKSKAPKNDNNPLPFDPDKEFLANAKKKRSMTSNTPFASDDLKKDGTTVNNEPAFSAEGLKENTTHSSKPAQNEPEFSSDKLLASNVSRKTRTLSNSSPFGAKELSQSGITSNESAQTDMEFAYESNRKGNVFRFAYGAGLGAGYLFGAANSRPIRGQLQMMLGIRQNSQQASGNFFGIFPTVEFLQGTPISLEAGAIVIRHLRCSAGVRYYSNSGTITTHFVAPTATVGFHYPVRKFYASFDLNGFYFQNNLNAKAAISIGLIL